MLYCPLPSEMMLILFAEATPGKPETEAAKLLALSKRSDPESADEHLLSCITFYQSKRCNSYTEIGASLTAKAVLKLAMKGLQGLSIATRIFPLAISVERRFCINTVSPISIGDDIQVCGWYNAWKTWDCGWELPALSKRFWSWNLPMSTCCPVFPLPGRQGNGYTWDDCIIYIVAVVLAVKMVSPLATSKIVMPML